jgi:hypothetical protein
LSQVYIHDGEQAVGKDAIVKKLGEQARMHAGFRVVHQVNEVDCQPLGVVSHRGVSKGGLCGGDGGLGAHKTDAQQMQV